MVHSFAKFMFFFLFFLKKEVVYNYFNLIFQFVFANSYLKKELQCFSF